MKISLLTLSFTSSMVAAFAPSISSPRHHLILKARADSSDAINEALKISSKYGNDSKEARVA